MSRTTSRSGSFFSPTQRKACIVLVCCALAIIATFLAAWVLPGKLDLNFGGGTYDPDLYPVDTTLDAVLDPSADAGSSYITSTVFVGDQYTISLQSASQITLNQYVGAADLTISEVTSKSCVNFVNDGATYTIPQALAKMKPRRVILTLGSNNVDGSMTVDSFLMGYRQVLSSVVSAYPYCDVIVNSIPPVVKSAPDSAVKQQNIDQFNQKLAELCQELGYKFLNSSEVLKGKNGFAETSYFDASSGVFSKSGVNTFLTYVSSHAWETGDQRPDTNDIPQRAASASEAPMTTPTPTPRKHAVIYTVEEGKGTLSGNNQTGASTLEFEVNDGETVTVTAVPAEGYSFYKWSDGQTSAVRVDSITQDLSVTAMFNDTRVGVTLTPGSNTTMKMGESLTVSAAVTLGGKSYDNSKVQWAVNDDLQMNGGSYTFTPSAVGTYTIKAGIEINGNYQSAQIQVTVEALPTTISISGTASIQVGTSTTLTADVKNPSGDTVWRCDQTSWTTTGNQVQFTANEAGTYTLRARNNNVEASFTLTVTPRPTEPPSTPTPSPEAPSDESEEP